MALSRQALDDYDAALSQVEEAASEYVRRRVGAYLSSFPDASVADAREFAKEAVGQAVDAYGDAASEAACELYDALAETAGEALRPASVDTSDASGLIDRVVRFQAGKLVGGAPAAFAARVSDLARDQVARRANQTMRSNAARDGIRYARVPMGGETCTYCAMLAGRGFAYRSASAAGEGNHYHPNCRCKVVTSTAGSVEGYDPGEWRVRWRAMEEIDADPKLTAAQKLEAKGRISSASASRLGSGLGRDIYPPMEPVEGMRYDPSDEQSVRQFISDAIELIKDEPVEHAYALQADGTVMHSSGDSVGTGMGGLASNGATVIHNHPIESGEPGSFGADDIKWVSENPGINALHVISDGVLYTITPTGLTGSASWDWAYGKLTLGQLMDAEDSKHLTMEVLADGGYIEYQRRQI